MCFLQVTQLNTLITLLIGELTPGDRQKIMTICTIDVHARDTVAKLISHKARISFTKERNNALDLPDLNSTTVC